jgi:hypothetical protein
MVPALLAICGGFDKNRCRVTTLSRVGGFDLLVD